jgi:hypothetical protein
MDLERQQNSGSSDLSKAQYMFLLLVAETENVPFQCGKAFANKPEAL